MTLPDDGLPGRDFPAARRLSRVALTGRAPTAVLGHAPIVLTRPRVAAADRRNDSLLQARSALRRAITVQKSAELQTSQLRELVARLESERPGL